MKALPVVVRPNRMMPVVLFMPPSVGEKPMPLLKSSFRRQVSPQTLTLRLVGVLENLQDEADREQVRQSRFQAWQACWAETREKLQQRVQKIDAQLARLLGQETSPPQLKIVLDEESAER